MCLCYVRYCKNCNNPGLQPIGIHLIGTPTEHHHRSVNDGTLSTPFRNNERVQYTISIKPVTPNAVHSSNPLLGMGLALPLLHHFLCTREKPTPGQRSDRHGWRATTRKKKQEEANETKRDRKTKQEHIHTITRIDAHAHAHLHRISPRPNYVR